jgi:hypothetical protein
MQPTKEQWNEIEQELRSQFGRVELEVDGFDISLQVKTDHMKLVVVVYVNGWAKGEWLGKDCEERRRFMAEKYIECYTERYRKLYIKLDGLTKRQVAKQKAERTGYYARRSYYQFHFTSFRALKSKLVKNNKSIEVVSIGYAGEDND